MPLGFAAFITMSRVAAYKHDFSDVNAGMAIGLLSGIMAYMLNYSNPLDVRAAGSPRLRPLPPPPRWLVAVLGEDAVPKPGFAAEVQQGYSGLHEALMPAGCA